MALIGLGLLRRTEVQSMHRWKLSTREGRFRDSLQEFGALISEGTVGKNLVWLTEFFKSKGLVSRHIEDHKANIFMELVDAADQGAAPIVGVRWQGGSGHWLLVVGYQGIELDGHYQLTHLLCLGII